VYVIVVVATHLLVFVLVLCDGDDGVVFSVDGYCGVDNVVAVCCVYVHGVDGVAVFVVYGVVVV